MLLGADPELFILDHNQNPINVIRQVKNSKDNPIIINNNKFYYDNVCLEFNFPPAKSAEEFVQKTKECLKTSSELASPNKISNRSAVDFHIFDNKNKNFIEVGCDPDINAYNMSYNKIDSSIYERSTERYAGGHIHIGGSKTDAVCDPFLKPIFVYMMDLFVGIPSIICDDNIDAFKRKKYYGKGGSFRQKEYGIEYRVLSPYWLRSPKTTKLIYNLTKFVFDFMNDGSYEKFIHVDKEKLDSGDISDAYSCYGYNCGVVSRLISNNDVVGAKRMLDFIENFMPHELVHDLHEDFQFKPTNLEYDWFI